MHEPGADVHGWKQQDLLVEAQIGFTAADFELNDIAALFLSICGQLDFFMTFGFVINWIWLLLTL